MGLRARHGARQSLATLRSYVREANERTTGWIIASRASPRSSWTCVARQITYWPARSMLTHFRHEIRDALSFARQVTQAISITLTPCGLRCACPGGPAPSAGLAKQNYWRVCRHFAARATVTLFSVSARFWLAARSVASC